MARVFYPYVAMPEKPQIARALRDELGWDPVLWVAYPNQRDEIAELFPEACFQTIADAFYGRPFPGLNSQAPHVPSAKLWGKLQSQIPTMLAMMNYYGPPDVFLYAERERFARNLLLRWNELIAALKPDVVFFEEAPHAPHTWALYALCLEYGIPTPFFMPTAVPTFSVLKDRVDRPPLRLAKFYREYCQNPAARDIHPDIQRSIALLADGNSFRHWYMDVQRTAEGTDEDPAERDSNRFGPALHAIERLGNVPRWPHYAKTLLTWPYRTIRSRQAERSRLDQPSPGVLLKHPGRPLGDPPLTLREYYEYKEASTDRKTRLQDDYLARCVDPDSNRNRFVYLALHYQPERTTDSDGGVFRDQYLAAAILHEALPDGWLLYVKEHPSQFAAMLHGDKGRTTDLYDDLQMLPKARLIHPGYSSKALTMASQAVATVSGTAAWEAALNRKPALAFGYTWYDGCPGVYSIGSVEDALEALAAIQSGTVPSEDDLTAFLQALSSAAFRVDLNAWLKDEPEVTLEEQIDGVVRAMTWWNEHRTPAGTG